MATALAEGVANGLREHVPGAIGIVIKSAAICLSVALAHFALAVPVASTAVGATSIGVIPYLIRVAWKAR